MTKEQIEFGLIGINAKIQEVNKEIEKLREEKLKNLFELKKDYEMQLEKINNEEKLSKYDNQLQKLNSNPNRTNEQIEKIAKLATKKQSLEETLKELNKILNKK